MDILKRIVALHEQGIKLWLEDGNLRFKARKGAMTPAIKAELKAHKNAIIDALFEAERATAHVVIPQVPSDVPVRAAFPQERLWLLDRMIPGNPTYHVASSSRLSGPMDVVAFEDAHRHAITQYDSLRTGFVEDDGIPLLVLQEFSWSLTMVDLSGLPDDERIDHAQTLGDAAVHQPFDLARAPLLHMLLIRERMDNHMVASCLHHIICDGWSMELMQGVIVGAYEHLVAGKTPALIPQAISFRDYAHWSRAQLEGGQLKRIQDWWFSLLAGKPEPTWPTDHVRPARMSGIGQIREITFEEGILDRLHGKALALKASNFEVALASLYVLFHHFSGSPHLTIGTAHAGRELSEVQKLVGLFVNLLPIHVDLTDDPSFDKLVLRVKERMAASIDHGQIPFERIVEVVNPVRDDSRHPLFQCQLTYFTISGGSSIDFIGLKDEEDFDVSAKSAKMDITFALMEGEGKLFGAVEFDDSLFEPATIDGFMAHWQVLLARILAVGGDHLSALPLPALSQRHCIDWWRQFLGSSLNTLEPPSDFTRPAQLPVNHGQVTLPTPCEPRGLLYVAAWALVIARFCGSQEYCLGYGDAGRPLPIVFDPAMRFSDFMTRCAAALALCRKQVVPDLAELAGPVHEATRHPVFQIGFRDDAAESVAALDLCLSVHEGQARLVYAAELFRPESANALLRAWSSACRFLVGQPKAPLGAVPLLDASERSALLSEINGTPQSFPRQLTLVDGFARQVAVRGDAVAVRDGSLSLSFRELDAQSNQLARHLRGMGIGPGSLVGMFTDRGIPMMMGILAALKCGGSYLGLDVHYPPDRLTYQLNAAGVDLLLTDGSVPPSEADAFEHLDLSKLELAGDNGALDVSIDPLAAAYSVFTSGSTGNPKHMVISHRNVMRLMHDDRFLRIEPGEGVSQIASPAFDGMTFEVWIPLIQGGRLCFFDRLNALDPEAMGRQIAEMDVSVMFLPTALFNQLARAKHDLFAGMHYVIPGGEKLDPDAARLVLRHGPPRRLVNGYGPSESTTFAVYHDVVDLGDHVSAIPIGRPINFTSAIVVDRYLELVPQGFVGELLLGGDGLAHGYPAMPGLTAEKFCPDPFAMFPDGENRLYRTGDLVRVLPGGTIDFKGRVDRQVKIRGFRIEPGEVEHVIKRHEAISNAVVQPRMIAEARVLVAWMVPHEGMAIDAETLRLYLAACLPDYMVPTHLVFLKRFPITPNGKVDTAALPDPGLSSEVASVSGPTTETEKLIAEIWSAMLGKPVLDIDEGFFNLGGHSLLAAQTTARIREKLRIELPMLVFFQHNSVAELAAWIDANRSAEVVAELPPIVRVPRDQLLLPSFPQSRMLFIDQMEGGRDASYNMPVTTRLQGEVNPERLRQALMHVVARHESLRCHFGLDEGGHNCLIISEEARLPFHYEDLSHLGKLAEDEAIMRLRERAQQPFDLFTGPLIDVVLFRLGEAHFLLMINLHHIISDGWSLKILYQELYACYDALEKGQEPDLPALDLQYTDYAHWQRKTLTGPRLERELAFWEGHLRGVPMGIDLPTDFPRPLYQSQRGNTLMVQLDPSVSEAIDRAVNRLGISPFMWLSTAFALQLSRFSGQQDICLGTPVANRNQRAEERMIGLFVNTVVLRYRLSDHLCFDKLLRQSREMCLAVFAHQNLPFERVVDRLHPVRDLSRSPIFQALFSLENTGDIAGETDEQDFPYFSEEPIEEIEAPAKFEVALQLARQGDQIRGGLNYNRDLFCSDSMLRFADQFRDLCAQLAAMPERALGDLVPQTVPADELEPVHGTLTERLYEAAMGFRDRKALIVGQTGLSYLQLMQRSEHLARVLMASGLMPGGSVGLFHGRDAHLVVAMLAAWRAGACFVQLDPNWSEARLQHVLAVARVDLVLTHTSLRDRLGWFEGLVLASDASAPHSHAGELPTPSPCDLACVLFSDFDDGTLRGTHLSQGALAARFDELAAEVGASGYAAATSPLGHDGFLQECFLPLLVGGTVVLLEDIFAVQACDQPIEFLSIAPGAIERLLQHDGLPDSVRTLLLIDSPVRLDLAKRLYQRPAIDRVIQAYNRPELGMIFKVLEADAATRPGFGSAGRHTRALLLDRQLRPTPAGCTGQLCLSGATMATGYGDLPARTARHFVPDPFATGPGGRLFLSGDLARLTPEGEIDFLRRPSRVLMWHGFRVETSEIEAVLGRFQGIDDQLVHMLVFDELPVLVAWVQPVTKGAAVDMDEMRRHLSENLPIYMVPAHLMVVEELPRNPLGQIELDSLPLPDSLVNADADVLPRSETEKAVAAIWSQMLGISPVPVHKGFFSIGGHSLLAAQVTTRIREALKIDLPIKVFFENSTVAELSTWLDEHRGTDQGKAQLPLLPVPREEQMPLSYAQERMWFLDRLEDGRGKAYNMPLPCQLLGDLKPELLKQAMDLLVARHETLRSRFGDDGQGHPHTVIDAVGRWLWHFEDLGEMGFAGAHQRALALLQDEAERPFDLVKGPLLRVTVFRVEAERFYFMMNLHHIICDGWSLQVLNRELFHLYHALVHGEDLSLPQLPIQYVDFSAWQRQYLSGDVLEEKLAFWETRLADIPVGIELPIDFPRPAVQTFPGSVVMLDLDGSVPKAIDEAARRWGVSSFMWLVSAYAVLLFRYSGQRDICIGTPVANRGHRAQEGLIGLFVNTVVLRFKLQGDPCFADFLKSARDQCLTAFAHQDVPFEKIVDRLQMDRDLSRSPVFQTMFTLENTSEISLDEDVVQSSEVEGLRADDLAIAAPVAKFELAVQVNRVGDRLLGGISYNTDLFGLETVTRFGEQFRVLTAALAASPDLPLSRISSMGSDERTRLLSTFNDTERPYDLAVSVTEMFDRAVARFGEREALVAGTVRLSYAELGQRATDLARVLLARGLRPGQAVAVCCDRNVHMITAMLAALKAGCSYVPLDPAYPEERIRFSLEDAAVPVLLTQTHLRTRLPQEGAELVCIDQPLPEVADVSLPPYPHAEEMAYTLFTSGSTGRPKGVAIPHRSVVAMLQWGHVSFGERTLRTAAVTSICFDLSVFEIFLPLAHGHTVVLFHNALAIIGTSEPITLINTVPSAISELHKREAIPASVATINLAGEPLRRDLVDRLYALDHVDEVFNLYGPSEDTTYSTWTQVAEGVPNRPTIGKPLHLSRVYITDREFNLAPLGCPGQLCIAGAGLARGYLGQPGMTAAKFVPDPFATTPGERLYLTGDLARFLPDGDLDFLGRLDHQVKLRGFRIELDEIETILGKHAAVQDRVCMVRPLHGEPMLIAWLTMAEGEQPTAEALREYVGEHLPAYMVPNHFVVLDAMPLTPNGKIDRKRLPDPEVAASKETYVAPQNKLQRQIAEVWAEVLKLDQVGAADNFFALGGHSLLLAEAHGRLQQELEREIPMVKMFEFPTVRSLARFLGGDEAETVPANDSDDRAASRKKARRKKRRRT